LAALEKENAENSEDDFDDYEETDTKEGNSEPNVTNTEEDDIEEVILEGFTGIEFLDQALFGFPLFLWIAAGVIVVLILVIMIVCCTCCRKKKNNENEQVGKEGALKSKKEVKRRSEVSMEKDSKKKKPIVSE